MAKNDRGVNIKIFNERIELTNVHSRFYEKSFWRDKFEILSNIFEERFIEVKIEKGRLDHKIQLIIDRLPSEVPFDKCPPLKSMQAWVGVNQYGNNVLIDLQSTPAIYVDGKPGAGKSVAINSMLESFLRGVDDKVELLVVSTKPADYYRLRNDERLRLEIIDPFEGDFSVQVEKILNHFGTIATAESIFKNVVSSNNIKTSDMKMDNLKKMGFCEEIPRKFFIFDEAKDYLSNEKSDSKEVSDLKKSLINAVYTHIRRTARFLSMPILIASQTQNESDLGIPLKMFHLRLASSTNEAMSRIICNDKRLTDLSYTKGKYFLKTDKEEHTIKIPLI